MARRTDPRLTAFQGTRVFDGDTLFRASQLWKGRGAKQAAKAAAERLRKRRAIKVRVTKTRKGWMVWEMIGRGL